jgi:hypothetical protein
VLVVLKVMAARNNNQKQQKHHFLAIAAAYTSTPHLTAVAYHVISRFNDMHALVVFPAFFWFLREPVPRVSEMMPLLTLVTLSSAWGV